MDYIQIKTETVHPCDAGSGVDQQYKTLDKMDGVYHNYSTDFNNKIGSLDVCLDNIKCEQDGDSIEIDDDDNKSDGKLFSIKYEQDSESTEVDEDDDIKSDPLINCDESFAEFEDPESSVESIQQDDDAVDHKIIQRVRRKRDTGGSATCTACNKTFGRSWHMKRHMRMVHARERPFSCPVCFKSFSILSDMNRHVRVVHESEKLIACSSCDRRFAKTANMRRHAAEAHGDDGNCQFVVCPVCEKIFANSRTFNVHAELFHGLNQTTKDNPLESAQESNEMISRVTRDLMPSSNSNENDGNTFENRDDKEDLKTISKYNPDTSNCDSTSNDIPDESSVNVNDCSFNSSDAKAGKLPTQCKICLRVFRDNWLMKRHERVHTGERPYECMDCGKSYTVCASLKEHILTHSNELVCPVCKRKFTRRYYMNRHECDGPPPDGERLRKARRKPRNLKTSTIPKPPRRLKENVKGVRRHVCTDCGQRFTRSGNLKMHQVIHTGERPFACSKCDSTFGTSSNLMMHVRQVHTDIRPFSCALCDDRSFARSSNYKTHARLCHGEDRPFQCVQCVEKFPLYFELIRHVRECHDPKVKRKVRTNGRGSSTTTGSLADVVKTEVVDNDVKEATNEIIDSNRESRSSAAGKRVFQCEICSKQFRKRWGLTSHMQTHSGARPHACKLCDKTFGVAATLQRHMVIHSGARLFPCSACDKAFMRPNDLRIHEMVHTGELPFACDYCGWRFTRMIRLKRHIAKYHSGKTVDQPFPCSHCGQTFLLLKHLQKHELLHDSERKFACAECNTRYTTSTDLRRHMMKHSGERPYVCEKCDRTFFRPADLRNHALMHEGKRPFSCGDCGKGYMRSSELRVHQRSHSKNPPDVCENNSKFSSALVNNLSKNPPDVCENTAKFSSTLVNDLSSNSQRLDDNLATYEASEVSTVNAGESHYACTLCDSIFSDPDNLQRHTQLHNKDQMFACTKCSLAFSTLEYLRKHENNHNIERKFACDVCHKMFGYFSNLKVHRLTHEKKK